MLTFNELPFELQKAGTQLEIASGQILFQQGESAQAIFWLESGQFKLVSFTEKQMITHYSVGAREIFAETALYFQTYSCTAIASQSSRVISIPRQLFRESLQQSSTFSEQYLAHLTHRLFRIKRLLELRSIRSARDRLLHYLFLHKQPDQQTVLLKQPLKELAIELGLSPETLSRTFTQLETEEILNRKKGCITLRNT